MARGTSLGALLALGALAAASSAKFARAEQGSGPVSEIRADVLEDRIRGGLLGEVLGNLLGLPHEMKYIEEPGDVAPFVPGLPQGARTDDDTDIEWVYLKEMEESGTTFIPPARIVDLWKTHINRSIWCANAYARKLMDLGLAPPLTGSIALNPWSSFNLSGQFLSEAFGLAAPALPRTASRIALHYTRVAIDGEPAQSTQLFASLVAAAFLEVDVERAIRAAMKALDPRSDLFRVATDVLAFRAESPGDWHVARRRIRDRWTRAGGGMRDRNGCELNAAATLLSLLYGRGDFAETLRLACAIGWDADNNAATAGTVLGVMLGRRRLEESGYRALDVYRNTTRDAMPDDETLTRYGDRIVTVARRVIKERGGSEELRDGRIVVRIPREEPAPVEPLPSPLDRLPDLRSSLLAEIERGLGGPTPSDRARAAYLAICLGESDRLRKAPSNAWKEAVAALRERGDLLRALAEAPEAGTAGWKERRERAAREGLLAAAGG